MITWFIFILAEILRNYYLIEIKKSKPIYSQSFAIRGLAAILHGSLIMQVDNWNEAIPLIIFQAATFYVLFDFSLNFLRRKPLLYKGENSGYLDKLPASVILLIKLVSTIIAFFIYLKYLLTNLWLTTL